MAWVPSTSPDESSWLWQRIDVLEVNDLSRCLKGFGVSPQRLIAATEPRRTSVRETVSQPFQDAAAQVEVLVLRPQDEDTFEARWTTSERLTMERCRELNPARPSAAARAAGVSLRQAFEDLVSGRPDPVLAEAQGDFTRCMVRLGYPAEPSASPEDFLDWVSRHRSVEDLRGRQVGADYVGCGRPVWRSTERARASVRLAFVGQRQAELRALTSLVLNA